jgi:hypothetical protein
MAEAIDESELTDEASNASVEAAKPEGPDERELPDIERGALVAHMSVPKPEAVVGDTPLSAIERLSVPGDLSPRIRRRDRLLTAAWAASFATLTALGVAGYTERDALMRQWPASKRVYATLGLAPLDGQTGDGQAGDRRVGDGTGGAVQSGGVAPAR